MAEDSGDVLGTWEDQADSGILDERLQKISLSNPAHEESRPRAQPIMMQEDTGRTEYKPQVRILKREPNTACNNAAGSSPRVAKVNRPMKTLEQREAEYAEARMRIFGAAEADPEPDSNGSDFLGTENCAEADSEKIYKINKPDVKKTNSILRQPKGPDGSKGFHSDR